MKINPFKVEEWMNKYETGAKYNIIVTFDETIAGIALEHKEKLLERSRRIVRSSLSVLDRRAADEKHVYYTKPRAGTTALA